VFGTGIYRSTNSGAGWTLVVDTIPNVSALAINGTTIIAGTSYNGAYRSLDNGTNWTLPNNNSLFDGTPLQITSLTVSSGWLYAGTIDNNGSFGGVYRSSNNASDWFQYGMIGTQIFSIAAINGVFNAGTYGSGVYFSTDNGTNWTQGSAYPGSSGPYAKVWHIAGAGSKIVAPSATGISFSPNGGNLWMDSEVLGNASDVNDLVIAGSYIFVAKGTYGIFRSPLP
jgi:hypothetical protein